jgi:hypothetical protein
VEGRFVDGRFVEGRFYQHRIEMSSSISALEQACFFVFRTFFGCGNLS